MMGTRGVPARYGGFETAIEEIGRRLVLNGHEVVVYCRRLPDVPHDQSRHLGMELVHLPAMRTKTLETLTHTAVSAAHVAVQRKKPDMAFVFNAANSPFLPFLRARRVPVAVHVDGLEWRRAKWGNGGRRYYRAAETLSVRWADALIADAQGIADYYQDEFGATTRGIAYGAPILTDLPTDGLAEFGLSPRGYHLVVARFEPENHVDLVVRGYLSSSAQLPLVVVGSAPYADGYMNTVRQMADADPRVHLVGAVWNQDTLNQLYAHSASYLHGHSIGGTNPSLLRAMGAGATTIALDVRFNRGVLGDNGMFFSDEATLATALSAVESQPDRSRRIGRLLQAHAAEHYQWDAVAAEYERLAEELARGTSRRGECSGRRRQADGWSYDAVLRPVGGPGGDGSMPDHVLAADPDPAATAHAATTVHTIHTPGATNGATSTTPPTTAHMPPSSTAAHLTERTTESSPST